MKKATNTENNPMPQWLMGGNPNAIEAQEAEGQKELINSLQLPLKCNSPRGINAAEQYHKMGIKTFTGSKGDDLFLGVKLPAGWKKEATDHSMWNNLIDDKGRVRATFFYKAAFYDRDAFINFNTRYYYEPYSPNYEVPYQDRENYCRVIDRSTKDVVFNTPSHIGDNWNKNDADRLLCQTWLKENFPDYESINAYWD